MIQFLLAVVFFFVGYVLARALARKVANAKALEHKHIWSPWKAIPIAYFDGKTGAKLYTLSGQTRNCLDCNFEQTQVVE